MLSLQAIMKRSRSATVSFTPAWITFNGTVSSPALSAAVSVTAVSGRSFPSAIWWYTSTMTATLMRLAVGNRMSPLTEKVWPVSRFLTAIPIVP